MLDVKQFNEAALTSALIARILMDSGVEEVVCYKTASRIMSSFSDMSHSEVAVFTNAVEFTKDMAALPKYRNGERIDFEKMLELSVEDLRDVLVFFGISGLVKSKNETSRYFSVKWDDSRYDAVEKVARKLLNYNGCYSRQWNELTDNDWELIVNEKSVALLRSAANDQGGPKRFWVISPLEPEASGDGCFLGCFDSVEEAKEDAEYALSLFINERKTALRKEISELNFDSDVLWMGFSDKKKLELDSHLEGGYFTIKTYREPERDDVGPDGDGNSTAAVELEWLKSYVQQNCPQYPSFREFWDNYTYDDIPDIIGDAEKDGKLAFTIRSDSHVIEIPKNFDEEVHSLPLYDYVEGKVNLPITLIQRDKPRK